MPVPLGAEQIEEMELSFSRGFSPGWINGCDHKQLVPGLSSAKRGVLLGHVVSVGKRRVAVRLQRSLRAGDGIVFEGDRASGQEQGGRVFQVWQNGQPRRERISDGVVELSFFEGSVDLSTVQPGCALWKTDDPELTRRLRRSLRGRRSSAPSAGGHRGGGGGRKTARPGNLPAPTRIDANLQRRGPSASTQTSADGIVSPRATRATGQYAVRTGDGDGENRRAADDPVERAWQAAPPVDWGARSDGDSRSSPASGHRIGAA